MALSKILMPPLYQRALSKSIDLVSYEVAFDSAPDSHYKASQFHTSCW